MTKGFKIDPTQTFTNTEGTSGKNVFIDANGKTVLSESWTFFDLGINTKDNVKNYMTSSKIEVAEGTFIANYEYNENYTKGIQKKLIAYYVGLNNDNRIKATYINNWASVKYNILNADVVPNTNTSTTILKNSINLIGKTLKKDVVVVDTNQIILADRVASEVGTKFNHDKNNEVGKTLKDGISRTFTETSPAYPNGITLKVKAIKDKKEIIGALIIEKQPK